MDEQEKEVFDQGQADGLDGGVTVDNSTPTKNPFSITSIVLIFVVVGLILFTYIKLSTDKTNQVDILPQTEDAEVEEIINYQLSEEENEVYSRVKNLDQTVLSIMDFDHNGVYFVDGANFLTLYMETEEGACIDECLVGMIPYTTKNEYVAPQEVGDNNIGTVLDEQTGLYQYTWSGKKLYHYEGDKEAGSLLGDGHNMAFTLARP